MLPRFFLPSSTSSSLSSSLLLFLFLSVPARKGCIESREGVAVQNDAKKCKKIRRFAFHKIMARDSNISFYDELKYFCSQSYFKFWC